MPEYKKKYNVRDNIQQILVKDINEIFKDIFYDGIHVKEILSHSIMLSFVNNELKAKYSIKETLLLIINFVYLLFFREIFLMFKVKNNTSYNASNKILIEVPGIDERTRLFWFPLFSILKEESILIVKDRKMYQLLKNEFPDLLCLDFIKNNKYLYTLNKLIKIYLNVFFILKRILNKHQIGFLGLIKIYSIVSVQVNKIEKARGVIKLKPKAYISLYDKGEFGSPICLTLNKYHIPTFTFVHGAVGYHSMIGFTPVLSDYVFTWGKYSSDLFIEFGTPLDKIIQVGCNRIDSHSNISESKILKLKEKLLISNDKRTILFGFTSIITDEWINNITNLITKHSEYKYIIRPHPSTSKFEFESSIRNISHVVTVLYHNEYSLAETLAISDYLITDFSSVAFDSLFYNVPVIYFDETDFTVNDGIAYDLINSGVAFLCRNEDEVILILDKLKDSSTINQLRKKQNEFLGNYIQANGEEATKNMATAIRNHC